MNRRNLNIFVMAIFSVLIFSLLGCSANAVNREYEAAGKELPDMEIIAEYPEYPVPLMVQATMPAPEQEQHIRSTGSSVQTAHYPQSQRMVIKDSQVELLVENTDLAVDHVIQIASDYGGYVISASSWLRNDAKHANLRIAVPSTEFEPVLKNLRNIGIKVLNETASGQDVTAEYVDLETRLINLETTAERVKKFLDESQTVEEALRVNQELSRLEQEIESIKGQMRYIEGRSAFSTVTVILTPEIPTPTPTMTATPTPTPGWDPGDTLGQSVGVLQALFKIVIDGLIWMFVILGPFAILGLIIFFIIRGIWNFFQARRKKKDVGNSDRDRD